MSQFSKARNIPFWEVRVLQHSLQKLGEFLPHSFHLSWFEVSPMLGVWYIIYLSGYLSEWQIITSHAHVQYCVTIHYYSCSIDKYRNVEDPKFHNCGRLGISCFEKEGFCKTHPKNWENVFHFPSICADLRVLYIIYHTGNLSDWQIITSMHMYSIVYIFNKIAVVLTNTEMSQFWQVRYNPFSKGKVWQNLPQKIDKLLLPCTCAVLYDFALP